MSDPGPVSFLVTIGCCCHGHYRWVVCQGLSRITKHLMPAPPAPPPRPAPADRRRRRLNESGALGQSGPGQARTSNARGDLVERPRHWWPDPGWLILVITSSRFLHFEGLGVCVTLDDREQSSLRNFVERNFTSRWLVCRLPNAYRSPDHSLQTTFLNQIPTLQVLVTLDLQNNHK